MLLLKSKPVRAVLRWQVIATAAVALIAWPLSGAEGAFSAVLGGLINCIAGFVYFAIASMGRLHGAGDTIRRLVRAEGAKIAVVVIGLWQALTLFKGIVFVPFFIAFAVTAFLPGVAFLVRDEDQPQAR